MQPNTTNIQLTEDEIDIRLGGVVGELCAAANRLVAIAGRFDTAYAKKVLKLGKKCQRKANALCAESF
jgi:hypothetical protein